jgi:outer membrane protein OmpA-like peptidoglycan-associated protein
MHVTTRTRTATTLVLATSLLVGCASARDPYATRRDTTAKGAAIGAVAGAAGALATGRREADEILAGAAIGAVAGGGIGAYMDAQEEKLARIPNTSVERVDDKTLVVHFDSDILFDFDSAALRSDSRQTVDEVARVLGEYDKTAVVVQGHTDDKGSDAYNQELSERRADAVKSYLQRSGVADERLAIQGLGEQYPVASNASETGRQQNRRVEILLRAKA